MKTWSVMKQGSGEIVDHILQTVVGGCQSSDSEWLSFGREL